MYLHNWHRVSCNLTALVISPYLVIFQEWNLIQFPHIINLKMQSKLFCIKVGRHKLQCSSYCLGSGLENAVQSDTLEGLTDFYWNYITHHEVCSERWVALDELSNIFTQKWKKLLKNFSLLYFNKLQRTQNTQISN